MVASVLRWPCGVSISGHVGDRLHVECSCSHLKQSLCQAFPDQLPASSFLPVQEDPALQHLPDSAFCRRKCVPGPLSQAAVSLGVLGLHSLIVGALHAAGVQTCAVKSVVFVTHHESLFPGRDWLSELAHLGIAPQVFFSRGSLCSRPLAENFRVDRGPRWIPLRSGGFSVLASWSLVPVEDVTVNWAWILPILCTPSFWV